MFLTLRNIRPEAIYLRSNISKKLPDLRTISPEADFGQQITKGEILANIFQILRNISPKADCGNHFLSEYFSDFKEYLSWGGTLETIYLSLKQKPKKTVGKPVFSGKNQRKPKENQYFEAKTKENLRFLSMEVRNKIPMMEEPSKVCT